MNLANTLTAPLEPDRFYHLYNRGNNKETIFFKEDNYYYFLQKLHYYCQHVVDTYCYCLLPNHFHLLIRVKPQNELLSFLNSHYKRLPGSLINRIKIHQQNRIDPNHLEAKNLYVFLDSLLPVDRILITYQICTWIVSEQLRRFFLSYTKSINLQQEREGSLFRKNFRRKLIDSAYYLLFLIKYIHYNPKNHDIIDNWIDYPYSSFHVIMDKQDTWISKQQLLEQFGNREVFLGFHQIDSSYLPSIYSEFADL